MSHVSLSSSGRQADASQSIAQPGREEGYVAPGAHPVEHERPEDWGWHGETGKWARIGGWITVLVVLAYLFGNHEGDVENLWVIGIAGLLALVLIWDRFRRKNAWRSR
jgi:Protein of unknown function (DUF2631)